jgi:hypothetical protein
MKGYRDNPGDIDIEILPAGLGRIWLPGSAVNRLITCAYTPWPRRMRDVRYGGAPRSMRSRSALLAGIAALRSEGRLEVHRIVTFTPPSRPGD